MGWLITQGDVLTWALAEAERIKRGASEPYHRFYADPPYLLEFMRDAGRDAPHRHYAELYPDQVAALVDVLGLPYVEAAAVLWWREVGRALLAIAHPGALLAFFAGPRTVDFMVMGLRAAGWIITDQIMYIYANGMAHGHDIGKALAAAAPEVAQAFDGYNTHLRPAYEPCVLARAPHQGSYATVAQQYGTPGYNLAGASELNGGRYAMNLIMEHHPACNGVCHPACPVAKLEHQSPGAQRFFYTGKPQPWEREAGCEALPVYMQARLNPGGLSREPRFAPKPSHNPHPTLKSMDALIYLATMLMPGAQNSRWLVPFCGSGSELASVLVAANGQYKGVHVQGVELDADSRYPGAFVPIANARAAWWNQFAGYETARTWHQMHAQQPADEPMQQQF